MTLPTDVFDAARDDFDDYLSDEMQDPAFQAAFEDAAQRARLVRDLVSCRKAHKLRQKDVAGHMGVRQPFLSEFETSSTDAHFSTLQRYARALGARLRVQIELPADQAWASHVRSTYSQVTVSHSESASVVRPTSALVRSWADEVEHRGKMPA